MDSQAVFTDLLHNLQLGEYAEEFKKKGWVTLGVFAFAANYVPGTKDDEPFIKDVVIPLLGREDHPAKPMLRRLFFEAFTVMAEEMKGRLPAMQKMRGPGKCTQLKGPRGWQWSGRS